MPHSVVHWRHFPSNAGELESISEGHFSLIRSCIAALSPASSSANLSEIQLLLQNNISLHRRIAITHHAARNHRRQIAALLMIVLKREAGDKKLQTPPERPAFDVREAIEIARLSRFHKNLGFGAFNSAQKTVSGHALALNALWNAAHLQAMRRFGTEHPMPDRDEQLGSHAKALRSEYQRHERAFFALEARIHEALILKDGSAGRCLRELISWVTFTLPPLANLLAYTQSIAASESGSLTPALQRNFHNIAFSLADLRSKAMASSQAALICLFDINGIGLDRRTRTIMSRAATVPLRGYFHIGKRCGIERVKQMPEGFYVCVQGIVTDVEVEEKENSKELLITLADPADRSSLTAVLEMSVDEPAPHPGSMMRVSGQTAKARSRPPIVRVAKVGSDIVSSQEIWIESFRSLSSGYVHRWPGDHLATIVPAMDAYAAAPADPPVIDTRSDPCDAQKQAWIDARAHTDSLWDAHVDAMNDASSAKWQVQKHCKLYPNPPLCEAAQIALTTALNEGAPIRLQYSLAMQAEEIAHKAWQDCKEQQMIIKAGEIIKQIGTLLHNSQPGDGAGQDNGNGGPNGGGDGGTQPEDTGEFDSEIWNDLINSDENWQDTDEIPDNGTDEDDGNDFDDIDDLNDDDSIDEDDENNESSPGMIV